LMRERVISIRWKMMMMVFASGFIVAIRNNPHHVRRLLGGIRRTFPRHCDQTFLMMAIAVIMVLVRPVHRCFLDGQCRHDPLPKHDLQRGQPDSRGNLDVYIPVKSKDEIGRLAADVNRMAAQLKKSIEEERKAEKAKNELITSVSHDLRTPLTSILGFLALSRRRQVRRRSHACATTSRSCTKRPRA
jgi:signal transduction histidine kinase